MHGSGLQKEMAVVGFFLSAVLLVCICGGVGLCSQKDWKRAELEGGKKPHFQCLYSNVPFCRLPVSFCPAHLSCFEHM